MNVLLPGNWPNSYIGRSVPRPNARRLLRGQGQYVDEMRLPCTVHLAFVRSPYAHARIVSIDVAAARAMPGVVRVVTAADLAPVCTPWVGVLAHFAGLKSAPQHPAALVAVEWEELTPLPDAETALSASRLFPELRDDLALTRSLDVGGADAWFAAAHAVVEETFASGRHTGVTLVPRAILADWTDDALTVWHSQQAPHMLKESFAKHLGLAETQVRVICRDVGGSSGFKMHTYPDEMTACASPCCSGVP